MKVIFIVGLPASGKTTLGQEIADRNNWTLLDDFSLIKDQEIPRDIDLVITDPTACLASPENIQKTLEEILGKIEISFIAFENDLEQCLQNNRQRGGRTISDAYIRTLASRYDPKHFSEDIRPVFRSSKL